jgi:chromosome segregation ATPase
MTGLEVQKSDLQSQAEKLSMVSHEILHQSCDVRNGVEQPRKKIRALATQLRNDLTKSTGLKDALDNTKAKMALMDKLMVELDANARQAEQLQRNIIEQKQILGAVRVSTQAKRLIDEIGEQTDELLKAKSDAEQQVHAVSQEVEAMLRNKERLRRELERTQVEFEDEQMAILVLESELKHLRSEFERIKSMAIVEARRNVELQRTIREQEMDATVRYLATHAKDIHKVGRV